MPGAGSGENFKPFRSRAGDVRGEPRMAPNFKFSASVVPAATAVAGELERRLQRNASESSSEAGRPASNSAVDIADDREGVAGPLRASFGGEASRVAVGGVANTTTGGAVGNGTVPGTVSGGGTWSAGGSSGGLAPKWRKVLYEVQPYEDNHTDASFLAALVLNANVRPRSYWAVVRDAGAVVQQMSAAAVAGAACAYVLAGRLTVGRLLALDGELLLAGAAMRYLAGGVTLSPTLVLRSMRACGLLLSGLYVLSPMLQTLTSSTSDDTISALVGGAMLVHLYLTDYAFLNGAGGARPRGAAAVAAAVFASVLLASRLPTASHAFGLLLLGLQLFILSPFVRRDVRLASTAAHAALTVGAAAAATAALVPLGRPLGGVFVGAALFVALVCPMWLVRLQRFKHEIHGPWDEAALHQAHLEGQ